MRWAGLVACVACSAEPHVVAPTAAKPEPVVVRAAPPPTDPCARDDRDACADAAVKTYYAQQSRWGDRHDAKKQLRELCWKHSHAHSCFLLADIIENNPTDPVERPAPTTRDVIDVTAFGSCANAEIRRTRGE
jgi:hypothetical protein